MTHPSVSQWVNKNYPRPAVDADWLRDCCAWITDEHHLGPTTDFDEFIGHVETQLLQSSLEDSMVPGTGLPQNIGGMNKTTLSGNPILVEIRSITDIAQSAFSLQTTRQMRIDRADLAGLAPEAEEDEGPIPKYPRGMLSLELSDGSVMLRAIEYRHLPGLELGVTPLGFKVNIPPCVPWGCLAFVGELVIPEERRHSRRHRLSRTKKYHHERPSHYRPRGPSRRAVRTQSPTPPRVRNHAGVSA
ncbi:hypothetical protein BV22DRAFT_1001132 [Leucogyrophana mollusca]|uniref:Uncharacterized protein n=1 Tax=Leucogyrophana mollusca TaxID=85980 RepID=A0ACB8BXJ1_9AGAM|nr:hypothetical protein BV22DRAFT_1001132 [Leucogyrophana mollusca]